MALQPTQALAVPTSEDQTRSIYLPDGSLPLVVAVSGHTTAECDRYFADIVAGDVAVALKHYAGKPVILNTYSPPWTGRPPQGFFNLCFQETEEEVVIGITFGAEPELEGVPNRRFFEWAQWHADPSNPFSAGIYVAGWDECWYLVCKILQALSPSSVHFSFGA